MAWQQRILCLPAIEDLTQEFPGDNVVWLTKEIVVCPHCGKPGASFYNGIVHSTDENRVPLDCCISDAPDGSPEVVVVDVNGVPVASRAKDEQEKN